MVQRRGGELLARLSSEHLKEWRDKMRPNGPMSLNFGLSDQVAQETAQGGGGVPIAPQGGCLPSTILRSSKVWFSRTSNITRLIPSNIIHGGSQVA